MRAQPAEDAGELDRDIAAADDDDALGQFRQEKGVVGGDDMPAAVEVGHERPPADGDQDLVGRDPLAADIQHMVVDKDGAAVEDFSPRPFDQPLIDAVQPGDLAVLVGDQLRPGVAARPDRPAEALGVLEILGEMGGIGEQFLGHAADIDAGAAEMTLFGHPHLCAMGGGDPGCPRPARPGADDKEIEIVPAHAHLPILAGNRWSERSAGSTGRLRPRGGLPHRRRQAHPLILCL